MNPATAGARFRESLDVILKCWTEDGPQSFAGDFYTYRYLATEGFLESWMA